MEENKQLPAKVYDDFFESLKGYQNNASLIGLFQFALSILPIFYPVVTIPVVGIQATQAALFTWAEKRKKKWRVLAKELDCGENITDDFLENAEFLHCFYRVIEATERTW